jgi:hypothetical protein
MQVKWCQIGYVLQARENNFDDQIIEFVNVGQQSADVSPNTSLGCH